MPDTYYEKIQSEIIRPAGLCLHCGRCMPIIDGDNFESCNIDPTDIRGPKSVWDEFPNECGYTGWLFREREKQKSLIRKIKEKIHEYSLLHADMPVDKGITASEKVRELKDKIAPWENHGSKNW